MVRTECRSGWGGLGAGTDRPVGKKETVERALAWRQDSAGQGERTDRPKWRWDSDCSRGEKWSWSWVRVRDHPRWVKEKRAGHPWEPF